MELPPGYKKVEYIQSTNNAFISTNYIPTRYDEFDIEFMIDATPAAYFALFSSGIGTYQLIYLLTSGTKNSYFRYFSSNASASKIDLSLGVWYRLTLSRDGVVSVNGKSQSYTYQNEIDGNYGTMYILRRRDDTNRSVGKIKSFKVTNNGVLKLNLVPCVRLSDNVAGAYDTVTKTFYSSASSNEEFTPGRTVY